MTLGRHLLLGFDCAIHVRGFGLPTPYLGSQRLELFAVKLGLA